MEIELKKVENIDGSIDEKCKGVNLGKQLLNLHQSKLEYNKIIEITENNYNMLRKEIKGPYRFGCI